MQSRFILREAADHFIVFRRNHPLPQTGAAQFYQSSADSWLLPFTVGFGRMYAHSRSSNRRWRDGFE
jgi:hypothetical protein